MEVTTQVSTTPAFASANEALEILKSAMGYLAAIDPTQMPAAEQAQILQGLEQVDAVETAARASVLGGFTARRGYCEDADYSPRTWLIHQTRITRGAAAGHIGWARRATAHPVIRQALAVMDLSASVAWVICQWTDKLPGDCRDQADAILAGAAASGLDLADVVALAAEMVEKSRPAGEDDPDRPFRDRSVRLETTFQGAGVLAGELTPECAAMVRAVLDALSVPAGAEDTRTHAERFHDGLEEACRRLIAADLLPERAGQPVKALVHISLADLIERDGDSVLLTGWIARVRAQWAAARAATSVNGGGDGGAWLDGAAATGFACDASITPVVFGEVNHDALEGLVELCVELAGHGPGRCGPGGPGPQPPTERGREALELAIIGKAVDLVSGPGGLASFLRRRELGARLGGPSLPLDVGWGPDIPAGIRRAVMLRDRHCQWAGGCSQPASMCEVHHLVHLSHGGKTSVKNCILLCHYHHQVVIHRLGWTLVLNPDGTTTAWNPDRTKVIRSHSPPARAG
jgi:Domain of unknown function (DUF222)/HNH endonuclease